MKMIIAILASGILLAGTPMSMAADDMIGRGAASNHRTETSVAPGAVVAGEIAKSSASASAGIGMATASIAFAVAATVGAIAVAASGDSDNEGRVGQIGHGH